MKSKLLRTIIGGKNYYLNRMETMDNSCVYYLELATKASNRCLKDAFIKTAEMYSRRYKYYFQKISENSIFA